MDDSTLAQRVQSAVAALGVPFRVVPCEPALADTATFCARYGFAPEQSANCIIVAGKGDVRRFAACVVLATNRLDVNGIIRRRLQARKCSFATPEETIAVSDGMQIGGVTPFGLPDALPIWVDARVMAPPEIIVGGGSRSCKLLLAPAVFKRMPAVEIVTDLAR